MKIVVFQCSPRIGGNTEILLKEALKPISNNKENEIKIFQPNSLKIMPCQDCDGCNDTGICIIKDDMTDIYEWIRQADRIILASPIYFLSLSAQAKIVIDRCQCFWHEKYSLKKPILEGKHKRKGLVLLVGGMKSVDIKCIELTAKSFFRTISISGHNVISVLGINAKGDILNYPEFLRKAYIAGEELGVD